ncbi:MAG: alanine racemase [bacterium]|nr:alanine racemase [Gammaproteobacteria bacterium]HIL94732.1 alanine racemase [Pseudomonadales bacterium]
MKPANSPTATVHLNNIQSNFDLVRSLAPRCRVMVVVKADAYGHGVVEVSQQLSDADAFAVARVTEGLELRQAGFDHPVVVLGGFINAGEQKVCQKQNLIPVIHSEYQLHLLDNEQPAWLKINSGMNRLGFNPDHITGLAGKISQKNIVGIMSHFANADDPEHSSNSSQIKLFSQISDEIRQILNVDISAAIANSGGILGIDGSSMDWVRPGIMLYGGSPTGSVDTRLKAGMTLTAPVLGINELQKGDSIGYGGLWTAHKHCRIAVVGLGYADGYPREMPQRTPVLLGGQRRQLVGRVSMDTCFVELEDNDKVQVGDKVTFWGEELPIDEIARCAGTVSYTLMSGLTRRVDKVYQRQ